MKPAEIRALSENDLNNRLSDLHNEWRELRFEEAVGKLTATARIRTIRKTIARIHTIRTERRLDDATRAAVAAAEGQPA